MGGYCSTDKGSDSIKHEKGPEDPPPSNHPAMRHLQHVLRKMSGKKSTPAPRRSDAAPDEAASLGFQEDMERHATAKERQANDTILAARRDDEVRKYSGSGVSADDHFSRIAGRIEETQLFKYAEMLPKGAHLHVHFNSTLKPSVLLGCAMEMENMYVWSDIPLLTKEDFDNCKIEFGLQNFASLWEVPSLKYQRPSPKRILQADLDGPNPFSRSYVGRDKLRLQHFQRLWEEAAPEGGPDVSPAGRRLLIKANTERYRGKHYASTPLGSGMSCNDWLVSKLVFSDKEVLELFDNHQEVDLEPTPPDGIGIQESVWPAGFGEKVQASGHQDERMRARRAWMKFDARTRMMKGLFNYERAFRVYTRKCLEELIRDNVQYVEIRPNFMPNNSIMPDNGDTSIFEAMPAKEKNGFRTMRIIIEEYERFMKDVEDAQSGSAAAGNGRMSLSGLKVIYCTPRSFSKSQVAALMDECIELKKDWPEYVAGFDLVGEEAYGRKHPLDHFKEEFDYLKRKCQEAKVDIPLLLHCGETPDDLEGNLDCALEVGSKRIGHGYALPKKPEILKQMRANGVCVEACPISNMILGLNARMRDHALYPLLSENMHCALASDNGTLFRSTLSHDFYEAMVGHPGMNLYGWKQLAKWSIEDSCMSEAERARALSEWERRWEEFVETVASGRLAPLEKPERLVRLEQVQKREEARDQAEAGIDGVAEGIAAVKV